MIITQTQIDQEGYIHVDRVVRSLGFGVVGGLPTVWMVTDPLNNQLPTLHIVYKRPGDSISPELMQTFVGIINDPKDGIWMLFEEPSKLAMGPRGGM